MNSACEGYGWAAGFLSRVYLMMPEFGFLARLRDRNLLSQWPLSAHDRETGAGLESMDGYVREWSGDRMEALMRDYSRLFIGPGEAAHPYESGYLGKERILFDDVTLDVRKMYRSFRLRSKTGNRVPDDHIGLELAFVSEMAHRVAGRGGDQGIDTGDAALGLKEFLFRHLMKWVDVFLDRVMQHAATGYYLGAARLTRGTLNSLVELVNRMPGEMGDG